jgi:hypothetical protein
MVLIDVPATVAASEHVLLYDECNFVGNEKVLETSTEDLQFPDVHSVFIPRGKKLTLYSEVGYGGDYAVFLNSVECITGDM